MPRLVRVPNLPKRFLGQVAYATGTDGSRVVLRCKRCGKQSYEQTDSPAIADRFARYWSKEAGGVASFCESCDGR